MFGRGGKAVEVINDKALALPPLDLSLARGLIEQTHVVRALRDYRDVPAADIDAVALLLVKLSQLSADIPEVRELELNPVLADSDGVVVVDARASVAPSEGRVLSGCNPRFAVAPYPKAQERRTTLKNGTPVQLRPVRPEDEEMYKVFFAHVSPEDIRLRFFAHVKEFSHAFIARLIQIDYARSFVCVAVDENTGLMLGVVRLMLDVDHEHGEYAILLRSDLKGQGLGWKLMKYMIEFARAEGIKIGRGPGAQREPADAVDEPGARLPHRGRSGRTWREKGDARPDPAADRGRGAAQFGSSSATRLTSRERRQPPTVSTL